MKYLKALLYEEFRSKIHSMPDEITESENIPIENALNRVCAQEIKSAINVPHFPRAMRDGYAVRAEDTFGASNEHPIDFTLVEEIPAGSVPTLELGEKECSYVATGSMMPGNANGVVMIEYASVSGNTVRIKQAIPPDTWVVPIGKDVPEQCIVMSEGTVLNPAKLGVLAAVGLREVVVFRKPRVGLLSTGNEILDPKQPLEMGKIYDINTITILNSLNQAGAEVTNYGIVPDDLSILTGVMQQALATQDVIISSGGTSKGKEDLMPQILTTSEDVSLYIHGVRMKPGKPTIYARWSIDGVEKPIFVLPGNPESCLLTYLFLVDPLIRNMAHRPPVQHKTCQARVTERVYSELGRREFKTVTLSQDEQTGEFLAKPIPKGSESITALALADGVFVIDEMRSIVDEGDMVEVILLT
jgi:molybdenum cofactor synthesis domain-containing protein